MKMTNSKWILIGTVFLLILFSIACSKTSDNSNTHSLDSDEINNAEYNGEDVTLTMMLPVDEETFETRFKTQVEKQFPNIELELIGEPIKSEGLQELIATGEIPDLIWAPGNFEVLHELDLLESLDPYVSRFNFDLGIFQEGLVDLARSLDPTEEGQLYGMPLENMPKAMFFNKDIFDLFGVHYPKNGITWEQTLDLARKLTQEQNGVQYKGLSMGIHSFAYSQLSIKGSDPETGEVLFPADPGITKFFELLNNYRNIPEMINPDGEYNFTSEQNLSMTIGQIQWLPLFSQVEGFNFDMVTMPTWSDLPNVGPATPPMLLSINKHSDNKAAAWAVIEFLSSEKAQMHLSKIGHPPTIANEEVIEQFGANIIGETEKTYNLSPIFNMKKAKLHPYSKYGPNPEFNENDFIHQEATEFLKSDKDSQSFIREMGERYEIIVKEIQGQEE
ncbi:extracellular solute-binding protein [Lederbergia sp. NSJ-179]|uniref:ABC transporter substrate-binding protein n=1 Tax=Lederbergia sp. NSJ-179 TaxID=2931402 RepID=UPI001FD492C6|nr:extracellular solute-binding protein [Lederbergia sp. NSJ-179]MCJ7842109.1 extracellular solute-binding protein [Lederbergia sp. NSJ-179]